MNSYLCAETLFWAPRVQSTTHSLMHKGHRLNWSLSSSGRSLWLDSWNGHYRCWCIICLQYFVANGLCATWFDLMREAAVFLHAPDKLQMSATKHNKDVMHALLHVQGLINQRLYRFYIQLLTQCLILCYMCRAVNVSPVTRPVLPCVYINIIKPVQFTC